MSPKDISDTGPKGFDLLAKSGPRESDNASGLRSSVSRKSRVTLRAIPAWDDGGLRTPDSPNQRGGALSGGGRSASRSGSANGNPLRQARGRHDIERPFFDLDVPPNGYAWWYVDGISDDGKRAISVIGFIGSVFSPWYRWSGRKDPQDNVCINVATYGPGGRFTMTDRGRAALQRSADTLRVGPSAMHWQGNQLVIDVNEIGSLPLVARVRGQIRVTPSAITDRELMLTPEGSHIWRPFAPTSTIEVDLGDGWQWTGHGYFDANFGTRALEQDFRYWTWGRYPLQSGSACFYDADRRDGSQLAIGLTFDKDGTAREIAPPPRTRMRRSLWAVRRETRADPGYTPHQVKAMLDAPFYTRSAVKTQIDGQETVGVHEALDLDRFASPLLMPMLAVRVPRRSRWAFPEPDWFA